MTNDTKDEGPTIEEDLAELEAYFQKGPVVSRAACGRMVTTYRLIEARARGTVGASNGRLREQVDQLRYEIAYLCDRILEIRAAVDEQMTPTDEHLITEAANDRLREERVELDQLNGRLLALLDGTVVALKGPHPERGLHDLSDVPALAQRLVAERETLRRIAAGGRDAPPVTELIGRLRDVGVHVGRDRAPLGIEDDWWARLGDTVIDAAVALEIQQDNVESVEQLTDENDRLRREIAEHNGRELMKMLAPFLPNSRST